MVCDCQCGISSVGIVHVIVYDCLIVNVWYVIISIFDIHCMVCLSCDIHFVVGNCPGDISGVDIVIFRVKNCLIFYIGYVIILVLLSCE